jgi:outer membrane translocation and assembly module TamA
VSQDFQRAYEKTTHQFGYLIKASSKKLGSQLNFISASAYYHHRNTFLDPLLTKFDLELGAIMHESNLPASWLFRTGGPVSVMGYPVDVIGPGNYLSVYRLGVFYPLYPSWYIGYWVSAGSADKILGSHLKFGHALALDLQTPLGAIELAIAKAPSHGLQFSITLLPL